MYRLRTAIRERVPWPLASRIPKGKRDCGNHEWYKQAGNTWRCYHCIPGETHVLPWDGHELAERLGMVSMDGCTIDKNQTD